MAEAPVGGTVIEKCGHPQCGKGFHIHTPSTGQPHAPDKKPEPIKVRESRPRLPSIPMPGAEYSANGSLRRGLWMSAKCRECRKEKLRKDFYASSGKVCRACFNARATNKRPRVFGWIMEVRSVEKGTPWGPSAQAPAVYGNRTMAYSALRKKVPDFLNVEKLEWKARSVRLAALPEAWRHAEWLLREKPKPKSKVESEVPK